MPCRRSSMKHAQSLFIYISIFVEIGVFHNMKLKEHLSCFLSEWAARGTLQRLLNLIWQQLQQRCRDVLGWWWTKVFVRGPACTWQAAVRCSVVWFVVCYRWPGDWSLSCFWAWILHVAGGGQQGSGHLPTILLKEANARVRQLHLSRTKGERHTAERAEHFSVLSGIWYKMWMAVLGTNLTNPALFFVVQLLFRP